MLDKGWLVTLRGSKLYLNGVDPSGLPKPLDMLLAFYKCEVKQVYEEEGRIT